MELGFMADVSQIVGTLLVIGGAVFGLVQLKEYRSQRRDTVAVEIVRSFQDAEFARGLGLIRDLPDAISLAELRKRGSDYEAAAMKIATYYESVGLLTFRRIVPFSIVRELTGGICVVAFRKLATWMNEVRKEQRHDSFAEWFQWLAERLAEQDDDKNANPAYRRYATWRPRG
jgi:hypothetical protein